MKKLSLFALTSVAGGAGGAGGGGGGLGLENPHILFYISYYCFI